jgi:hypothetical protein
LQERFRREAVTAARLVHPGIVAIFDAGVEVLGETGAGPGAFLSVGWPRDERSMPDGTWPDQSSTAFIVMELVPGETLRDLIGRAAPLSPQLAMAIAAQVADALAYAHAQGLVHRDIKPANVLLGDEGGDVVRVKVADFGIAKAAATAGGDLTANGTVLGTPKYLSPEQVQGKEPDPRADLYSLGVVLFEMLAGRPPFQETTDMATALAHVQQPVPELSRLVPGLPPELADLVGALLVKDPERRVPSALVLGAALARARSRLGTAKPLGEPAPDLHGGSPPPDRTTARPGAVAPAPGGPSGTVAFSPGGTGAFSPGETVAFSPGGTGASAQVDHSGDAGRRRPSKKGRVVRKKMAAHQTGRRRRAGRSTSVVVAALLVAGIAVTAALMHSPGAAPGTSQPGAGGGSGGRPDQGSLSPVPVLSVHELTQDGIEPNDNLNELPNVIGNNPAKYWESDIYTSAEFGGSGGFGLVLELDGPHLLHQLAVSTPMNGWSAEVFTSGSNATTLSGWGQPRSHQASVHGDAMFSLGDKKASWVLFWMVDPGPSRQAVVRRLSVT